MKKRFAHPNVIPQREKPQKVDARAFVLVARRRTCKERQEECSSRLRQLSSAPSSACVRRCTRALCGKCLCFTVRFSFSSSLSSSSFVGEMNPTLLCFRCLSLSAGLTIRLDRTPTLLPTEPQLHAGFAVAGALTAEWLVQKEQSLQKDVDALVAERRERNADFASSSSSSGALKSAFK